MLHTNVWVQAGYHTCGLFLVFFPFIGKYVGASTTTTTTFPPSLAHTARTHSTKRKPRKKRLRASRFACLIINDVFAKSQFCTTAFRRFHCSEVKSFRGALLQIISKLKLHKPKVVASAENSNNNIPKMENTNTNGFDARRGLKQIICCLLLLLLLLLLGLCACMLCALRQYSCGGCQSTTPGRVVVQCVRRACCAVCVWLDHPPHSPGYPF